MKVVASGVDTLIIGFMIDSYRDEVDFEVLHEAKQKAGEKMFNKMGYPVTWFGTDFSMKASGGSGYEWILRNDDVLIRIAKEARRGRVFPEVFITFYSQYLWTRGLDGVLSELTTWLNKWAIINGTKVSRCDLSIDLAMQFPQINLTKEIVTRARNKVDYSSPTENYINGRRSTGYKIGSGDLSARLYDKTNEIIVSQKEWFRAYWLEKGWDGETPITRCEFQCRRNFLKDMSVNSYEDLTERMADIWRYCTHDWLKICYPGSKTNQSRWEVKEYWQFIQDSYSLFGQALGVLRYKVRNIKYDHLIQLVRGAMVSACANKANAYSIHSAMFILEEDMNNILKSEDFRNDVISRQAVLGNMDKPDTHLIDEAIKLGAELIDVELKEE
ncbi:hypothetical protein ACFLTT_00815 [Chloroflexota bacterium]